jgi:hypothetical protein
MKNKRPARLVKDMTSLKCSKTFSISNFVFVPRQPLSGIGTPNGFLNLIFKRFLKQIEALKIFVGLHKAEFLTPSSLIGPILDPARLFG